jgi:hypothetical protein
MHASNTCRRIDLPDALRALAGPGNLTNSIKSRRLYTAFVVSVYSTMAILKLFSASSSRSPSPASFQTVKITHHVHAFGGIYLPSPSAPSADSQPEVPYGGRLEIHLTPGSGRRKCQSIKVGIRTISTLDLGQKRGKEEDIVFERVVSLGEGTILEEGSQLYVPITTRLLLG